MKRSPNKHLVSLKRPRELSARRDGIIFLEQEEIGDEEEEDMPVNSVESRRLVNNNKLNIDIYFYIEKRKIA